MSTVTTASIRMKLETVERTTNVMIVLIKIDLTNLI